MVTRFWRNSQSLWPILSTGRDGNLGYRPSFTTIQLNSSMPDLMSCSWHLSAQLFPVCEVRSLVSVSAFACCLRDTHTSKWLTSVVALLLAHTVDRKQNTPSTASLVEFRTGDPRLIGCLCWSHSSQSWRVLAVCRIFCIEEPLESLVVQFICNHYPTSGGHCWCVKKRTTVPFRVEHNLDFTNLFAINKKVSVMELESGSEHCVCLMKVVFRKLCALDKDCLKPSKIFHHRNQNVVKSTVGNRCTNRVTYGVLDLFFSYFLVTYFVSVLRSFICMEFRQTQRPHIFRLPYPSDKCHWHPP